MSLYVQDGLSITTHSMLKAMRHCPQSVAYKYAQRLKPRTMTARDKPLHRGTWFHKLLEEFYAGRDWRKAHAEFSSKFGSLFDEERDALGDLPREMELLMRSYLWHYGADKSDLHHGWKVRDTELTLECAWPDGNGVYRCRLDILYEDDWGLWIGDHKTHVRMPETEFRLRDAASALYIWCAWENGLDVSGFVWNYVKAKAPTKPALVDEKRSPRLSRVAIETDFPTYLRAIKEYGLDPTPYKPELRRLKAQRWKHGAVQASPFFRRDTLDKDEAMVSRVVAAAMRTRDHMEEYDWSDDGTLERVGDRSCSWCTYNQLCAVELAGGPEAGSTLRRKQFRVGDPLDYYQDDKPTSD